jgi:hypothetical protein
MVYEISIHHYCLNFSGICDEWQGSSHPRIEETNKHENLSSLFLSRKSFVAFTGNPFGKKIKDSKQ